MEKLERIIEKIVQELRNDFVIREFVKRGNLFGKITMTFQDSNIILIEHNYKRKIK